MHKLVSHEIILWVSLFTKIFVPKVSVVFNLNLTYISHLWAFRYWHHTPSASDSLYCRSSGTVRTSLNSAGSTGTTNTAPWSVSAVQSPLSILESCFLYAMLNPQVVYEKLDIQRDVSWSCRFLHEVVHQQENPSTVQAQGSTPLANVSWVIIDSFLKQHFHSVLAWRYHGILPQCKKYLLEIC